MGLDRADGGKLKISKSGLATDDVGLNPQLTITTGGNVGVGETDPAYPIHISRDGAAVDSYPGAQTGEQVQVQMYVNGAGVNGGGLAISENGGFFDLDDGYITYLPLASGQGLRVQGSFRVVANAWPDFVFEDDYQLKSLDEVQRYIAENGHLPGVPAAAQIQADGVDVGEMNAVLLRKVEELTLHMIEMSNEIDALKSQLDDAECSHNSQQEGAK
jgi:hypothetical protein